MHTHIQVRVGWVAAGVDAASVLGSIDLATNNQTLLVYAMAQFV